MNELLSAALVVAVSALLLRQFGWRGTPVFVSVATIFLISNVLVHISGVLSFISSLPAGEESAVAIVKIIGVGYLYGIASDVCRELGESSVASLIVLLGRVETVAIALPFIKEIASLAVSLLG